MSSIANKSLVLALNANWQPVGIRSVRMALKSMAGSGSTAPAKGVALSFPSGDGGQVDYDSPQVDDVLDWASWIELPVRDTALGITTPVGEFRFPPVIVEVAYAGMPTVRPAKTRRAIFERNNYTCQYTGERLPVDELDLDHVRPRARGGDNSWSNLVTCSRKVNRRKGSQFPAGAGLTLIRKPKAPAPLPICAAMRRLVHPSHRCFLPALNH